MHKLSTVAWVLSLCICVTACSSPQAKPEKTIQPASNKPASRILPSEFILPNLELFPPRPTIIRPPTVYRT